MAPKVEVPDSLFGRVLNELVKKAYNWQLPFETKLNLLYFCHAYREKLKGSKLYCFPALMLTYIRNKEISEGEKNFVRTVAESFYRETPSVKVE
jgi:hypothetical protein